MNVTRRFILKSIVLSGLAGTAMGRLGLSLADSVPAAQARPARPTLVLVSGETEHSAFLQGIAAALPGGHLRVQRTDLGMGFVRALSQLLRVGRAVRIIGLVDDASAALIVELARAADARLQWLGHHSVAAGQFHHRPLGGNAFSELAVRLYDAAARDSRQWAATLGFVLASPGVGQAAAAPPVPAAQPPLTGHFVSFAIET